MPRTAWIAWSNLWGSKGEAAGGKSCLSGVVKRTHLKLSDATPTTLRNASPKAKLSIPGTAAELVEQHARRARVHGVVSKKPADGVERTIRLVDTILNLDPLAIPDPIFGDGLIPPSSIDRRISPCVTWPVIQSITNRHHTREFCKTAAHYRRVAQRF